MENNFEYEEQKNTLSSPNPSQQKEKNQVDDGTESDSSSEENDSDGNGNENENDDFSQVKISHRLAERKRRQDMSHLFEVLRDLLPAALNYTKTSKGRILMKG